MQKRESWLQDRGNYCTPVERTSSGPYWERAQGKWNKCLRWDFINIFRGCRHACENGKGVKGMAGSLPWLPQQCQFWGRPTRSTEEREVLGERQGTRRF